MSIMKLLFILFLFARVAFASSDQGVKFKIDKVLTPLESLIVSDPSGSLAQNHLRKEWLPSNVIQPYFYESPETLYEASPERDKRVSNIEQWMMPYQESLLKVLLAGQRNQEAPNAVFSYLQFTAPTPEVRDALLSVAKNPNALIEHSASAYNSIFMLDMGYPDLINEIIIFIKDPDKTSRKAELGRALIGRVSGWARPEMKEIYVGYLSIPYNETSYSFPGGKIRLRSDYQHAIMGLKAFGKLDENIIFLIKERLNEIPQEEDPVLHRVSRDALLIAEGKLRPEPTVNLKGQLLGISKEVYPAWLVTHPIKKSVNLTGTFKFKEAIEKNSHNRESSEIQSDHSQDKLHLKKYYFNLNILLILLTAIMIGLVMYRQIKFRNK